MQTNNLHMFPVTPEIGIDRKKDIENRFKALQRIDPKIRYQIRLGEDDFKVFVKIYTKGEYDSYREFPIEYFDPNEHVREQKLYFTKTRMKLYLNMMNQSQMNGLMSSTKTPEDVL